MSTCFPGVEPLPDPPPYRVGWGDILRSLQDHRLKDDEPLRVPLSVPLPTHLFNQGPEKATPYISTWRVITTVGNDCEVTLSPLPHLVACDAPVEVIAGVGVHLVPIDLLESEVLRGRGVTQKTGGGRPPPPVCARVFSPFGHPRRPIPFPVPLWSFGFPCLVC